MNNILKKKFFIFLIFALSALTLYFPIRNAPFQFDDITNIVDNSNVNVRVMSYEALKKATIANVAGLRPVAYVSFAINYYFSQRDTTSYHIVNIIIHAINAFLIYLIILLLFSYDSVDDKNKERILVSAFFTALIWLCVPLNSQTVIYIVQRMMLLMTFFFLLGFHAYILGRKKKKPLFFVLSVIYFALSILSKQNAIIFPIVILIYEFIFAQKGELKRIKSKEIILFTAIFMVMLLALFFYKDAIYKGLTQSYAKRDFTMYERVLTQFRVLVFYLSLLVFPLPSRFSINHDFVKSTTFFSPPTTILSFIFLVSVIIIALARIKKSPYFSFAALWFFITISVESSVLPLEMAYEHRAYLPSIFLIGFFVDTVVNKFYKDNKLAVVTFFCGLVFLYGIFTAIRGAVWKDSFTLWQDVINKYPNDVRAYGSIGSEYYNMGDYEKALHQYEIGFKLSPNDKDILFCMGNIYTIKGNYNYAEILFKKAVENSDVDEIIYSKALNNLGWIYFNTRRYKEAQAVFERLNALSPKSGLVHYNLAQALQKQRRYIEAVKEYQLAIEYDYPATEAYVEMVRCVLYAKNTIGITNANEIYEKYKTSIEKMCVADFIKGMIAEHQNELQKANEYYNAYLSCKKTKVGYQKDDQLEQNNSYPDPYPQEALEKLENKLKRE